MDCCKDKKSLLYRVREILTGRKSENQSVSGFTRKIALVGSPNVGKSVIFNSLTGAYVTVSNYPGTTVEVSKGWYVTNKARYEIVDTPGMYSIFPLTEEESVTRKLLLDEKPDMVMHVVDAKNIGRMLPLTLQLIEAGLSVVLVLNVMDEAKTLGVHIDCRELEKRLGIPVVEASAALNLGIDDIKKTLEKSLRNAA